ncbi:hypothetical protein SAMN04515618_11845 [Collimonas sp. OK307]|uniref:hypothetical protein n=1 Tax=Collimonas sp. OK307 TaxID=1801620 RepID=UPI0008E6B64C|nr:hypothetical protein [Collimonas sp. OK307]SFI34233.1 hypothetical protein SAMN04515618_11845 [Collimonas sp. OK307]
MIFPTTFRLICLAAVASVTLHAHAESFTSSAVSTGSASSGSMSASLHGSSNSSTGDEKTADGNYRVIEVAAAPDRAGVTRVTRVTMQIEESRQRIVLDLPQAIVEKQKLGLGDTVLAQHREYGFEFARADTREAFYLVLADEWYNELAARPVTL